MKFEFIFPFSLQVKKKFYTAATKSSQTTSHVVLKNFPVKPYDPGAVLASKSNTAV